MATVAVDANGNVYVAGTTGGNLGATSFGASDAYVRKYDSAGTVVWTRQFGSSAGDLYVAGAAAGALSGTNAGGDDAYVRRFHGITIAWTVQFGTPSNESAQGVAVDGTGNVYVVGETSGAFVGTSAGGVDAFVRRIPP